VGLLNLRDQIEDVYDSRRVSATVLAWRLETPVRRARSDSPFFQSPCFFVDVCRSLWWVLSDDEPASLTRGARLPEQ
jgi:hypothetical protein